MAAVQSVLMFGLGWPVGDAALAACVVVLVALRVAAWDRRARARRAEDAALDVAAADCLEGLERLVVRAHAVEERARTASRERYVGALESTPEEVVVHKGCNVGFSEGMVDYARMAAEGYVADPARPRSGTLTYEGMGGWSPLVRPLWDDPYTLDHYPFTPAAWSPPDPHATDGTWYEIVTLPHEAVSVALSRDDAVWDVPVFEGDVERREWEQAREVERNRRRGRGAFEALRRRARPVVGWHVLAYAVVEDGRVLSAGVESGS